MCMFWSSCGWDTTCYTTTTLLSLQSWPVLMLWYFHPEMKTHLNIKVSKTIPVLKTDSLLFEFQTADHHSSVFLKSILWSTVCETPRRKHSVVRWVSVPFAATFPANSDLQHTLFLCLFCSDKTRLTQWFPNVLTLGLFYSGDTVNIL